MENFLGLPEVASSTGAQVDHMIGLVHWLMLALGVGWGVFFIYCLFRFRASKNPRANYTGVKSHFSTYLEIAVAFVEVILLIGFSIPYWATQVDNIPSADEALVVRVVAEQFAWNIHYPGADGKFGPTDPKLVDTQTNPVGIDRNHPDGRDDVYTVNELVLPVDQKIVIRITSKDVIHSFWLPQMRIKQDAIPGMEVSQTFTAIKTGDWDIACAQLCGLGHYTMKGAYSIKTRDAYDAWLREKAAGMQPAPTSQILPKQGAHSRRV
jgi:cytochrome c oxidase subunit 2